MPRAGSSSSPADQPSALVRTDRALDVPPTRIAGPRRPHSTDPLLIGVLIVIVALGAAITKPWGGDRGPAVADDVASVAPQPRSSLPPPVVDPADPWTAVGMLAALGGQAEWGVATLLDGPVSTSHTPIFQEEWRPAIPSRAGPVAALILRPPTVVRALVVTAPAEDVPLAIRAWARQEDGGWGWLDSRRPTSERPAADLVLLPPLDGGNQLDWWPAGRYRIDFLMGARVDRIDLSIEAPGSDVGTDAVSPGDGWLSLGRSVPATAATAAAWLALDEPQVSDLAEMPTSLLTSARRYAPYAGTGAFVITDARTGRVRGFQPSPTIGCGDDLIGETVPVLGITHPPGQPPQSVAMRADGPLGRTVSLRLRSTREVIPGLTLVAPSRGASFPDGIYRLILGGPSGPSTTIVCLGTAPFHG